MTLLWLALLANLATAIGAGVALGWPGALVALLATATALGTALRAAQLVECAELPVVPVSSSGHESVTQTDTLREAS